MWISGISVVYYPSTYLLGKITLHGGSVSVFVYWKKWDYGDCMCNCFVVYVWWCWRERRRLLLGFTTLFNILDHQRRLRHRAWKSDKFCSGALISAWGSFTCRKSTTWDPRLYFPSEGIHSQDFYALKKSIEPANLGSRGEYDNHWTTEVDKEKVKLNTCT